MVNHAKHLSKDDLKKVFMGVVFSKEFGHTKDGRAVHSFVLRNGNGMTVTIIDFGAAIQSIVVPDRNGVPTDVVLGYDDIASYENGTRFYGAIVGRYANRIKDGHFELDGKAYQLEKTDGKNHLHGVFGKRLFEASVKDGTLMLRYTSPHMEEGYPGNLSLEVCYRLQEDNSLEIEYAATTDMPTVVNLTNHCYFNLNGQDGSTVLNHKVRLNCSYFTEYDETFAQTGKKIPVENTPLDFRNEQTIGARFEDDYEQFRVCTGYDHNMVLDGEDGKLKPIGTAKSDQTGICLEAFTTEPAIQFYSGNFIHFDPVLKGKNGIHYPKNGGMCMEAQHYPDSIRHKNFPNVILRPGEIYRQKTVYRLSRF